MAGNEDHEIMIEALIMAIAIQEKEEAFFRRSATVSKSGEARALFLEIADEMKRQVESLEKKKKKLEEELAVGHKA